MKLPNRQIPAAFFAQLHAVIVIGDRQLVTRLRQAGMVIDLLLQSADECGPIGGIFTFGLIDTLGATG